MPSRSLPLARALRLKACWASCTGWCEKIWTIAVPNLRWVVRIAAAASVVSRSGSQGALPTQIWSTPASSISTSVATSVAGFAGATERPTRSRKERSFFFCSIHLFPSVFSCERIPQAFAHRSVAYSTYCCTNSLAGDRMMRQPAKERRMLCMRQRGKSDAKVGRHRGFTCPPYPQTAPASLHRTHGGEGICSAHGACHYGTSDGQSLDVLPPLPG